MPHARSAALYSKSLLLNPSRASEPHSLDEQVGAEVRWPAATQLSLIEAKGTGAGASKLGMPVGRDLPINPLAIADLPKHSRSTRIVKWRMLALLRLAEGIKHRIQSHSPTRAYKYHFGS